MQTNNETRVLLARTLARMGHANQVDKVGAPYFEHVERVANLGQTDSERIVGYLHDIVEDGHMTHEELEQLQIFSDEELEAIRTLNKKSIIADKDARDAIYYSQIKYNNLARRVKLNDLRDNMNVERFLKAGLELSKKDIERLNKYKLRHDFLLNEDGS